MSWVFGYWGKNSRDKIVENLKFLPENRNSVCSDSFSILYGGISDTLNMHRTKTQGGMLISGIVIDPCVNRYTKNAQKLSELIETDQLQSMDGHFVAISWTQNRISFQTDVTGLRDIYFTKYNDGFLFSTRVDWLAYFVKLELNFQVFGSRWLLINQITHEPVIKNTTRLVGGMKATIDNSGLHIEKKKELQFADFPDTVTIDEHIADLITGLGTDFQIEFSLSGGFDSRFLLSILSKLNNLTFNTHTFGNPKYHDSQIALQIADMLKLHHHNYYEEQFDIPILSVREYTCQTVVNNAASMLLQYRYYNHLRSGSTFIIDGGFGEIWRREFLTGLLYRGKKDLLSRNSKGILRHLMLYRSSCFVPEVLREMTHGCLSQIEFFIHDSPINDASLENWLDQMAINTRLINYYGPEQSRLDGISPGCMPFAQQSLLSKLMLLALKEKKDARYFRQVIKEKCPVLEDFPLAKGAYKHPYFYSTLQTRVFLKFAKRFIKGFDDQQNVNFLKSKSVYMGDIINSANVRECGLYDIAYLDNLLADLQSATPQKWQELDWWLSFELFRQAVENRHICE
ncbi:MAG: asparagine synthase-related protein [Ignavibacteria bacterium]|nr:asparagine synthase-related protein [Ignavibacteria bacterium]